jgi:hypothetical protein
MKVIPPDLLARNNRWDVGLRQITECLQSHDERYFLDCGTLLGAIRDNVYIPWDNDIDLGVVLRDDDNCRYLKLAHSLHRLGFEVNLSESGIACLRAPDVEINVTFYRQRGKDYEAVLYTAETRHPLCTFLMAVKQRQYRATFGNGMKYRIKRFVLANPWIARLMPEAVGDRFAKLRAHSIHVPSHHIETIAHSLFRGMSLAVPSDPQGYLALRYGAGWKTPKQNYRFDQDDGALQR